MQLEEAASNNEREEPWSGVEFSVQVQVGVRFHTLLDQWAANLEERRTIIRSRSNEGDAFPTAAFCCWHEIDFVVHRLRDQLGGPDTVSGGGDRIVAAKFGDIGEN